MPQSRGRSDGGLRRASPRTETPLPKLQPKHRSALAEGGGGEGCLCQALFPLLFHIPFPCRLGKENELFLKKSGGDHEEMGVQESVAVSRFLSDAAWACREDL